MTINIEDLAARVANLEDKAAIVDLLERYTQALDVADEATFVDCYTEDCLFEAHNYVTGAITRQVGRAEVRRKIVEHTRPPELYHQHLVGHPLVDLAGDTARARSYVLLTVGIPDGVPEPVIFGCYVDDLRRESDGAWRIVSRRAEFGAWNPIWTELRDLHRNTLAPRDAGSASVLAVRSAVTAAPRCQQRCPER